MVNVSFLMKNFAFVLLNVKPAIEVRGVPDVHGM